MKTSGLMSCLSIVAKKQQDVSKGNEKERKNVGNGKENDAWE